MKRKPVFSHNELMCHIAQNPNQLTSAIQMSCYQDFKDLVKEQEECFQIAANMVTIVYMPVLYLENSSDGGIGQK